MRLSVLHGPISSLIDALVESSDERLRSAGGDANILGVYYDNVDDGRYDCAERSSLLHQLVDLWNLHQHLCQLHRHQVPDDEDQETEKSISLAHHQ